jgi:hypothetical protein
LEGSEGAQARFRYRDGEFLLAHQQQGRQVLRAASSGQTPLHHVPVKDGDVHLQFRVALLSYLVVEVAVEPDGLVRQAEAFRNQVTVGFCFDLLERPWVDYNTSLLCPNKVPHKVPHLGDYLRAPFHKIRDGLIARVAGGMGSWDQDGEVQRLFIREVVREVGNRLAGPNPTAIERILAERASVCWLWAYAEDLTVLNRGPASMEQAKWDLQRQNAAHRRFLSAVKALATVQKLAVPILIKKAGQVYVAVGGPQKVNNQS